MINEQKPKTYDLEERTAEFGRAVIRFCKTVPQDAISRPLISQLVRSATSVGANYMEANSASSRKDFRNKIFIVKKEAQETKHWLRMLGEYLSGDQHDMHALEKETQELTLIFRRIISSLRSSEKD